MNRSRLVDRLTDLDGDGYLLDGSQADANQLYLSGFTGPDPFVSLYNAGSVHLLVSGLEYGRALSESTAQTVERYADYNYSYGGPDERYDMYAAFIRDKGVESVMMPPRGPVGTADALRARGIDVIVDTQNRLEDVRAVKTPAEIDAIRNIVKGNLKDSLKEFRIQMNTLAEAMRYEEAEKVKRKIITLEKYQSKSTVVNPKINNVDVFSVVSDEGYGYVNFMQLSHGAIIRSHTIEMKKKLDETDAELLELGITEIRQRFESASPEIYVPFEVEAGENVKVTVPKLGDKKAIVELSTRNAKYFRMERFKQMKIVDPDRHTNRLMAQMKEDLRLSEEPRHIECFDNSNIQGSNPVAACVVFKNGKPSKKDYRKFNIKTVEGPDDFASMEEVVYRRYRRLLEEDEPLPQLVIVDGGKGQLSSGVTALERLGLRGKIPIIGIAKRLEELFYPGDQYPLYLDKKTETLKIIQQLRNEAHRFGITFHRNKRSKNAIGTELEEITGIGEKTSVELLQHFRSISKVKTASLKELEEVIGVSKAKLIYTHYHKDET